MLTWMMRAYAQWAKKRLPTEEEWQHAAQGFEERVYPWGMDFNPAHCNHGGTTTSVKTYPEGRSPFGCYDMCGNVWELTESERFNGMSRFCILKGGSFYRAAGSEWYADGGPQSNAFSAKMLLGYPGIDRCATIGFRCAVSYKTA
jgi:formylglycine-generating enzyme required for sulfatase activity